MCAALMIKAAKAAPSSGPTTGTQEYDQSEPPLLATGNSACATRGPRSRAGLIAYPVVPPKDSPIDHTSMETKYGLMPGASPTGASDREPIAAITTISNVVPVISQNKLLG